MANCEYRAEQQSIRIVPDAKFMESFFEDYQAESHIALNAEQRNAVTMVIGEPAGIICGSR